MDEVDVVRIYHQRSKHQLQRYAAGPESLDWDAQPNPWRRYASALVEPLPLAADAATASWPELFQAGAVAPWALDRHGLGALLQISLGLSAWKTQGPYRWAVRCNPSSGNPELVRTLLALGADPSLGSQDDYSALDMAASLDCLQLLRRASRSTKPARPASIASADQPGA